MATQRQFRISKSVNPSPPLRRSLRIQEIQKAIHPSHQLRSPPTSQLQAPSKKRRHSGSAEITREYEHSSNRPEHIPVTATSQNRNSGWKDEGSGGSAPKRRKYNAVLQAQKLQEQWHLKTCHTPEPKFPRDLSTEIHGPAPYLEPAAKEAEGSCHNPVSHWVRYGKWPEDFATFDGMASSGSSNKRSRVFSGLQSDTESRRSYSQRRKDGDVPEQYTPAYERHIATKGMKMDIYTGKDWVAPESADLCAALQKIERTEFDLTALPEDVIRDILRECAGRNEGMISRDITTLIIPPIYLLRFRGIKNLLHVVDEVNVDWFTQCCIEGPRPRPDAAFGLAASEFSQLEMEKLRSYTTVDNWTQFTVHMYFPFLMCEVKCGIEGLDAADRQNMHSCSIAVKALLYLYQAAIKQDSQHELTNPDCRVLVFSISHDGKDARLYGHFARLSEDKIEWTYHRYLISKFDLQTDGLLALHNFVQNLFRLHLPKHIKNIKDCIKALPEPSRVSSGISKISLEELQDNTTAATPPESDGSKLPSKSASTATRMVMEVQRKTIEALRKEVEEQRKDSKEQTDKILLQMEKQLEQQRKESRAKEEWMERQMDQQRKESRAKEEWMERQMDQQRKESSAKEEQMARQTDQLMTMISALREGKGAGDRNDM